MTAATMEANDLWCTDVAGQALVEQSETDPASGQFTNRNYSGYLVPTNADIPQLDLPITIEKLL